MLTLSGAKYHLAMHGKVPAKTWIPESSPDFQFRIFCKQAGTRLQVADITCLHLRLIDCKPRGLVAVLPSYTFPHNPIICFNLFPKHTNLLRGFFSPHFSALNIILEIHFFSRRNPRRMKFHFENEWFSCRSIIIHFKRCMQLKPSSIFHRPINLIEITEKWSRKEILLNPKTTQKLYLANQIISFFRL